MTITARTTTARTIHALALASLCGLAAPALAQNALDRNLQQGSGGINQARPDFGAEVRFRNAVVTGNAPGGAAFRGSVGYTAPGEFFGNLGSNDTFAFRRDAVYSGLGGLGIRGTDALQYQFAMTTGNAPPAGGYGLPIVNRSGSGAMAASMTPTSPTGFGPGLEAGPRAIDFSRLDAGLLPMRSPSAYISSRGLQPTVLGMARDAEGQTQTLTASGLRGISMSMEPQERQQPLGGEIQTGMPQRQTEDPAGVGRQGTGADPQRSQEMGVLPGQQATPQGRPGEGTRVDTRLSTAVDLRRSPYEDLLVRLRQSQQPEPQLTEAGAEQGTQAGWEQRLTELREQLREQRPGTAPTAPTTPATPEGQAPAPEGGPGQFRQETIEMIRRGGEIEALAPDGFDAYANAMRLGQELLAAGRYFDAEARFTAALSAKPGDPMAAAGRVNAELGAGMFLSAALNLRTLLSESPEVAGVRYAANLLPAAERMPAIKTHLGNLLKEANGRDPDLGLLLAYMGWQTRDAAAVEQGLSAMTAGQVPEHARRLADLLRKVWTLEAPPKEGAADGK